MFRYRSDECAGGPDDLANDAEFVGAEFIIIIEGVIAENAHAVHSQYIKPFQIERAAAGKTVKEIAQETGLSYAMLTHLMSGSQYSNEYATRMATKLAEYFGRSVDELFFAVDLENPEDRTAA